MREGGAEQGDGVKGVPRETERVRERERGTDEGGTEWDGAPAS